MFYRNDSDLWVGYYPDSVNGDTWVRGETKEEAKQAMEATLVLKGELG